MTTPVREGETIEGSRTMRNRPYQVLKCSRGRYPGTARYALTTRSRGLPGWRALPAGRAAPTAAPPRPFASSAPRVKAPARRLTTVFRALMTRKESQPNSGQDRCSQ